MTPQEIMNLPHYGMAEKQLRKQKNWRLDPSEKLQLLIHNYETDISLFESLMQDKLTDLEDLYTALEGNE